MAEASGAGDHRRAWPAQATSGAQARWRSTRSILAWQRLPSNRIWQNSRKATNLQEKCIQIQKSPGANSEHQVAMEGREGMPDY